MEDIPEHVWDYMNDYLDNKSPPSSSDDDDQSDFSDSEGNYCVNDDCVMSSDNFVETNGQVICSICGTSQYTIHEDQEWNNYMDSQGGFQKGKARCSVPSASENVFSECGTFMPQGFKIQMTVKVCGSCTGKNGRKVYFHSFDDKECKKCGGTTYTKEVIYRDLSRLHMRINYNHKEKSYNLVKTYMENVCTEKYPTVVINTAMQLWEEVMKSNKLTRAGVREGLIACCIYYACIHNNCPLPVEKICSDFKMKGNGNFNKGDKEFRHVFEHSTTWSHLLKNTIDPNDLFTDFCNKLELPYKYVQKSREYVNKYRLHRLPIDSKSVAAGVIFIIAKDNGYVLKKVDVCKKLGVCNPTLTKSENLIRKKVEKKKKKLGV